MSPKLKKISTTIAVIGFFSLIALAFLINVIARSYFRTQSFDEMVEYCKKLASQFPFVRVDFYEVNGKCYFGELTLSHFNGMTPFEPEEWDYKFGEWITLPPKKSDVQ